MTITFCLIATLLLAQETPQDIPKAGLPKLAECTICSALGVGHGKERPAAGVMYKGASYFFCNTKEAPEFKKSPEFYLPLDLPMQLGNFGIKDQSGTLWDGEAFKGRLVLIDYWATWCKPCLVLMPKIEKIRESYRDRGFEVLSVSIDEKRDSFDKFLAKKKFENPVAWDDRKSWAGLRVASIPALFLVKDGVVIAQFRGNIDPRSIESAVKANLP